METVLGWCDGTSDRVHLVQMHYVDAPRRGTRIPYGERVFAWDRSWWRDGVVLTVAFVLCLLGGVLQVDDTLAPPSSVAYLLGAVSSLTLLARRRRPVVGMVAATACGMLVAPVGLLATPLTLAPAIISAYAVGARTERRTTVAVVVSCTLLLVAVVPLVEKDVSWADASRLLTVVAAPFVAAVLGRASRHRQAYLAFVEERALRAEETRESEARRRVAEERVRIARELHDLVAHQITLANAQASVAAHLFDTRPEQARESLDELVGTTRQALDELRATVGLLRQQDDADASHEPAPGLGRLPALVASFRRAGLEVSVQPEGVAATLTPAVDLTAYRIIQEALTNVGKHSAADHARVHLVWDVQGLTVTITDDGPGTPSGEPPGFGLVGLRERAAAVGGDLSAGPRAGGGFVVTAHLPLSTGSVAVTSNATTSEGR